MGNVLYIINPAGHGGAGTKVWEAFKTLWPGLIDSSDVLVTERAGHAREIAAARRDYEILAAVGGDGTVGEVMSGIMEGQGPKSKVAIIPCGTGNDIARSAGIFSVTDAVAALRAGHARSFDLVRVDCQRDGARVHGHGFLFGSAGFSAIPMIKPWMKRLLGPKGAYYLATFLQILAYRAPHMTVRTGNREHDGRTYMVIAGNAEWVSGGSMRMSPGALSDDGQLNVTIVPSLSKLRVITRLFPAIAAGTHINQPGVSYFAGKRVEVHSDPPAILDVDGDLFGTTPAIFTICPHAVQIMSIEQHNKKTVQQDKFSVP